MPGLYHVSRWLLINSPRNMMAYSRVSRSPRFLPIPEARVECFPWTLRPCVCGVNNPGGQKADPGGRQASNSVWKAFSLAPMTTCVRGLAGGRRVTLSGERSPWPLRPRVCGVHPMYSKGSHRGAFGSPRLFPSLSVDDAVQRGLQSKFQGLPQGGRRVASALSIKQV